MSKVYNNFILILIIHLIKGWFMISSGSKLIREACACQYRVIGSPLGTISQETIKQTE